MQAEQGRHPTSIVPAFLGQEKENGIPGSMYHHIRRLRQHARKCGLVISVPWQRKFITCSEFRQHAYSSLLEGSYIYVATPDFLGGGVKLGNAIYVRRKHDLSCDCEGLCAVRENMTLTSFSFRSMSMPQLLR